MVRYGTVRYGTVQHVTLPCTQSCHATGIAPQKNCATNERVKAGKYHHPCPPTREKGVHLQQQPTRTRQKTPQRIRTFIALARDRKTSNAPGATFFFRSVKNAASSCLRPPLPPPPPPTLPPLRLLSPAAPPFPPPPSLLRRPSVVFPGNLSA